MHVSKFLSFYEFDKYEWVFIHEIVYSSFIYI